MCKYSVESVLSERTLFHADSVEWCPFPKYSNLLVCGTYHLNEDANGPPNFRQGNITLYSVLRDELKNIFKLHTENVVESGGILDLKWCPYYIHENVILGAACSNGKTLTLCLSEVNGSPSLAEINCLQDHDKSIHKMILSLDWCSERNSLPTFISSDNLGNLNYAQISESEISSLRNWKAHDFEAWCCSFHCKQPAIFYSGGDDSVLKSWDTRHLPSPVFENKSHPMGVTAIAQNKNNEFGLATGCYDGNVRLWDSRSLKIPLSQVSLGGGIWRLKWHPYDPTLLLSASMHEGFHVLFENKGSNLQAKAEYKEHKSLGYGVDWSIINQHVPSRSEEDSKFLKETDENKHLIASCSFYDNLLHLWQLTVSK